MIRVLIVEDSLTVGTYLEWLFNQEDDMEVIGRVSNGKEAIAFCKRDKPDVISMDIEMPVMNGLMATKIIMEENPLPIVIVTASRNARETRMTMEALEAGAVTLIEKPRGIKSPQSKILAKEMINTIRLMADVKVVTRRKVHKPLLQTPQKAAAKAPARSFPLSSLAHLDIVAVGVSTGGPVLLKELLGGVDKSFPLPIVIVQHIAPGFLEGMVSWLSSVLSIELKIASDREILKPGTVYFAADNHHLVIERGYKARFKADMGTGICPSVSELFRSVYHNYGSRALAIILTGMGHDGAEEMKLLHDAGAVTVAQDEGSSLIFGMPKETIKLQAARYIMNPAEIIGLLKKVEYEFDNSRRILI